jgi:hypothetical protein
MLNFGAVGVVLDVDCVDVLLYEWVGRSGGFIYLIDRDFSCCEGKDDEDQWRKTKCSIEAM